MGRIAVMLAFAWMVFLLVGEMSSNYIIQPSGESTATNDSSSLRLGDGELVLDKIEIDEELPASHLILNLTGTVKRKLADLQVDSIKFDFANKQPFNLYDYFTVESKKYRLNTYGQHISQNSSQSAIILLKTSSKKLDREYLCRLNNLKSTCSCEGECLVYLDFVAQFHATRNYKLRLPIIINDINDNRPFFFQKDVSIDLDLTQDATATQVVKIPVKEAIDLDSMRQNRVLRYEVNTDDGRPITVQYDENQNDPDSNANRLSLVVQLPSSAPNNLLVERVRLTAADPNFTAWQTIEIKLKLRPRPDSSTLGNRTKTTPTTSLSPSSLNLIYFISASNEFEIQYSNRSNLYEINVRDTSASPAAPTTDSELKTLLYLIVEKSKLAKLSSDESLGQEIRLESEQTADTVEPLDERLFVVSEMRNGLYAISLKSVYYDLIKRPAEANMTYVNYRLTLTIRYLNMRLSKQLSLKIPANIKSQKLKLQTASIVYASTQPGTLSAGIETNATKTDINIYNSIVIVSIASAILVLFGVFCFLLALILYVVSRCRRKAANLAGDSAQDGKIHGKAPPESANIIVYDVLPQLAEKLNKANHSWHKSESKSMPPYSLASSSSSSCATNTNNISPVTTTTTSVSATDSHNHHHYHTHHQQQQQAIIGPLFQTHLADEGNEKKGQIHSSCSSSSSSSSPLSLSSSSNLIKPLEFDYNFRSCKLLSSIIDENSSTSISNSNTNMINKYKNDLYRNSHLIYKLYQPKLTSTSTADSITQSHAMYEARRVMLSNDSERRAEDKNSTNSSSSSCMGGNHQNELIMTMDPYNTPIFEIHSSIMGFNKLNDTTTTTSAAANIESNCDLAHVSCV